MWQCCPSLIPDRMYFSYIQDGGYTALRIASVEGHTEVAGVLIARGAVVDYQDKVRQSCMIRVIIVDLKIYMIIGILVLCILTLAWCSNPVVPCTVYIP